MATNEIEMEKFYTIRVVPQEYEYLIDGLEVLADNLLINGKTDDSENCKKMRKLLNNMKQMY